MAVVPFVPGLMVTLVRVSALQRVSHANYSLLDAAQQVAIAREPCLVVYRAAGGIKTEVMAGCIRWSTMQASHQS